MRLMSRWISAAVMVSFACGGTTAEQTVPKPQTPVQKATASPTNPDAAVLADFNARLEKYLKFQRDVAFEVRVFRFIHNAHSSPTELVQNAVMRNGFPNHCSDFDTKTRRHKEMIEVYSLRGSCNRNLQYF